MGTKTKILLLRRTSGFGGSEVVILDLLQGIDYQRHTVYLASLEDVFSGPVSRLKLPVEWIPVTARWGGGCLRVFLSWLWFLVRFRPHQIVLVQGGFFDFRLAVVLAAFLVSRGNVYMMEHSPAPEHPAKSRGIHLGFLPGLGLWWYRRIWPLLARAYLTRRILAVSNDVKERLVRCYGYPLDKVHVVYNGVNTSLFSPSPEVRRGLRALFGIPDDAVVITSTARLDRIKRLDRLVKAFGSLSVMHKNLWMLFAGDGPLRAELESLAKSVDPDHRIQFLGHVEDIRQALHASDVYVLPSDMEGCSIALAEAMSSGLICVATKTTGPREIIEDSENGFLVDPTSDGVLEGLQKALQLSKAERECLSSNARKTIVEKFRVEEAVTRGLTLLEIDQVEGDRPRRPAAQGGCLPGPRDRHRNADGIKFSTTDDCT